MFGSILRRILEQTVQVDCKWQVYNTLVNLILGFAIYEARWLHL
jgi:hypothetical protein